MKGAEKLPQLRMVYRLAAVVLEKVLLGHISDVGLFTVFRQQVVKRLVFAGAHVLRYRFPPFLGVAKGGIYIKNNAPEWKKPVFYYLANGELCIPFEHFFPLVDSIQNNRFAQGAGQVICQYK